MTAGSFALRTMAVGALTAAAAIWLLAAIAGADAPEAGTLRTQPVLVLVLIAIGWGMWQLTARAVAAQARASGLARRLLAAAAPLLLAVWLLYLWETVVVGMRVPFVLMPPPSAIGQAIAGRLDILAADFVQTFVKSVIPGYVIGCAAGMAVAAAAWFWPALGRALLPLGNFMSVMPIVGIAPIMVMWLGFDWQSKAAVASLMVFFPMLVNTLSGLRSAHRLEHDLMRTYAACGFHVLRKLLLPRALPFIFNGLKICSTLALIGAVVAEFFGTPIVGMGFRISSEVGRMGLDLVWATVVVTALVGTSSYGLLVVCERMLTFWHPSQR